MCLYSIDQSIWFSGPGFTGSVFGPVVFGAFLVRVFTQSNAFNMNRLRVCCYFANLSSDRKKEEMNRSTRKKDGQMFDFDSQATEVEGPELGYPSAVPQVTVLFTVTKNLSWKVNPSSSDPKALRAHGPRSSRRRSTPPCRR